MAPETGHSSAQSSVQRHPNGSIAVLTAHQTHHKETGMVAHPGSVVNGTNQPSVEFPPDSADPCIRAILHKMDATLSRLEHLLERAAVPPLLSPPIHTSADSAADHENGRQDLPVSRRWEKSVKEVVRSIPPIAQTVVLRSIQAFAIKSLTALLMFLWIRKLRRACLRLSIILLFKMQDCIRFHPLESMTTRVISLVAKFLQ
ncbi:hypothetical protein BC832DRAFT_192281 [Gaertneriomyces semiglobifer]|nr:hypothetical protein BC832DRAFT_192281 [Gaertneriomyces semiglobifer]